MGSRSGVVDTSLPMEVQQHDQPGAGSRAKYDVFLNHRGPDLKMTFVSHLYKALCRVGCEPFLDAKSLETGKHAPHSMDEALSGVLVHVAIFSPRYAESEDCLNELCDMLASGKTIIPVFYDVEPENLCRTDMGPFAEGFREHLKNGRDDDVVRWKEALVQAAPLTGIRLREDCGNDTVKLEEKIVAAVLKNLPELPALPPARHPVALKESSENVIKMLHKMGDSVGVIGICGMGGIGKTTLAREVYNRERSNFDSRCFLSHVKEATGNAVTDLQKEMVTQLLQVDARKLSWDSTCWFDRIRKHKGKVFIVVDDISRRQQLDDLIPALKELPPGSRVLITSREAGELRNINLDIPESEVYYVPELSFVDSLELFIWCAFRKTKIDSVDASFHDFVEDITRACGGLPLALEVMGGFLSDKTNLPNDEKYWQQATVALKKNRDINTSLQMSYDGLVEDEDKLMFLDIACFMLGHPQGLATEVWDSNGLYGSSSWSLSRLIDKCLVKVDDSGHLTMHDLVRDMGRNVVMRRASNKPEMQSHIWDPGVAVKALRTMQGSDEVLALSVVGEKSYTACKAEVYARMRKLRYLLLDDCRVDGDFSGWSAELSWLQWRGCPHMELPSSLQLPNLAVLDLANSEFLSRIWDGVSEIEILSEELRVLMLSDCARLGELPQNINKMAKLKAVDLRGCRSLSSLPDSLGDLTEMEYLTVSRCRLLNALPDTIVKLSKLEKLDVSYCTQLRTLPKDFGRLGRLVVLNASGSALEELPESFGLLPCLERVYFENCDQLRHLSDNFGCLRSLRHASLLYCKSLLKLPASLELSNLKTLELSGCKLLDKLPSSISKLKKLKRLAMMRTGIRELPEDFGLLQSLMVIDLEDCKQLQVLCSNFGCLSSLIKLDLHGCESLVKLPESFSELSNLDTLELSGCKLLDKLPSSISKLKKLESLKMRSTRIRELPEDCGLLQSLMVIDLEQCTQLQVLCSNFGCLSSLIELDLRGCESLVKLPESFSELSNLETLDLSGCKLLDKLPSSISKLKKLKRLAMKRTGIQELPEDFGLLQSLMVIDLEDCKQLQVLCSNFGCLSSLIKLDLRGCESLVKLPESFSELSNLKTLELTGCKLLDKLPSSISKLKKLERLNMRRTRIRELPEDFGLLQSLMVIDLEDCKQLQVLCSNFGCLNSLVELDLRGCESLVKLPESFSELSNMETLELSGCKLFDKLPSSISKLKKLKRLEMKRTAI